MVESFSSDAFLGGIAIGADRWRDSMFGGCGGGVVWQKVCSWEVLWGASSGLTLASFRRINPFTLFGAS